MDDLNPVNYSLSASHLDGLPAVESANPLPRAVLRPNSYQLLDGQWRFAHDAQNAGLNDQWAQGHAYEHTAQWPGSVEAHLAQARGQHDSTA